MSDIVYFNKFVKLNLGKKIKRIAHVLDSQTTSEKTLTLIFVCTNPPERTAIKLYSKVDTYFRELSYYLRSLLEKKVSITIIIRGIFLTEMKEILSLLEYDNICIYASETSFFQETGKPISSNELIKIF